MANTMGEINSITKLDTHYFSQAEQTFKQAVGEYADVKRDLCSATDRLLETWRGEGRQTFENKYRLYLGKMEDLQDVLTDYYEAILDAENAYASADESTAEGIRNK